MPKMPVRNIRTICDGRAGITGEILYINMLGWDAEKGHFRNPTLEQSRRTHTMVESSTHCEEKKALT